MTDINKILLVLQKSGPSGELKETLSGLGIGIIDSITSEQDIYAHARHNPPEAIIIECDILDNELLQQIRNINQSHAIPVIIFTDSNEDSIIEKAIKSGVSTYIVGNLEVQRIQSILKVAMTRNRQTRELMQDLDQTRQQLEERKLIDKAKGILMKHKQLDENDAYKTLRKMAMDKNKRIAEIADSIVSTFELLS